MENEPSLRFSSKRDDYYFWLRLYKGKTKVGQCRLYFTIKGACLLGAFIVYKQFRRNGYGSILLEEAVKDNRCVMLWVKPENVIAQNLYAKHGFDKLCEDHSGWMMIRKLNNEPVKFTIEVGQSMILE